MSKEKDLNKAANVVMSAPKGTYYAAIRDLAYIVLDELPEDRMEWEGYEWAFYHALKNLVKANMTGLALDTELTDWHLHAALVSNRILELCAKSREGAK